MAIAYVGEKATKATEATKATKATEATEATKATGNGSGRTEVITLALGCTAGNTVVLCFGGRATSTFGVGVTDSNASY